MKRILSLCLALLLAVLVLAGCGQAAVPVPQAQAIQPEVTAGPLPEEVPEALPQEAEEILSDVSPPAAEQAPIAQPAVILPEDGEFTDKTCVAAYLNQYGHLPSNFITKKEAKALGWDSSQNYVGDVAPGKSIGGDYFGNYEGALPQAPGRDYHECDIDYGGKKRNAKRIVYSTDGLIYYTEDHYETFELLYGEE